MTEAPSHAVAMSEMFASGPIDRAKVADARLAAVQSNLATRVNTIFGQRSDTCGPPDLEMKPNVLNDLSVNIADKIRHGHGIEVHQTGPEIKIAPLVLMATSMKR
ncbi:MAG: hypothetical protein CMJ77_25340 [Planctomycetaceae bacterium]|nr:hypothetical protein [Planctomycetaceae bacterium]